MAKKHGEEKHEPKKIHSKSSIEPAPSISNYPMMIEHTPVGMKTYVAALILKYPNWNITQIMDHLKENTKEGDFYPDRKTLKKWMSEFNEPKKTHTTPKKTRTRKALSDNKSIPSMTKEQTQAYMQFSEACKEVYEKFSKDKIDTRITQLKSSSALIAVVRFMVMLHDLLEMYGVMQFNKHVSPTLYKHLDNVQEQTGQKLPLARVLLDGIKTTKMELLSGVTVHPLPEFEEPTYEIVTPKNRSERP